MALESLDQSVKSIQTEINEIDLSKLSNFGDLDKTINRLKELAVTIKEIKDGTQNVSGIDELNKKITELTNNVVNKNTDLKKSVSDIANSLAPMNEAVEIIKKSISEIDNIKCDGNKEQLDQFQTYISTFKETLKETSKEIGSFSLDFDELNSEKLQSRTEDITNLLSKLMEDSKNIISNDTGIEDMALSIQESVAKIFSSIPKEIIKPLLDGFEQANGVPFPLLDDIISKTNTAKDTSQSLAGSIKDLITILSGGSDATKLLEVITSLMSNAAEYSKTVKNNVADINNTNVNQNNNTSQSNPTPPSSTTSGGLAVYDSGFAKEQNEIIKAELDRILLTMSQTQKANNSISAKLPHAQDDETMLNMMEIKSKTGVYTTSQQTALDNSNIMGGEVRSQIQQLQAKVADYKEKYTDRNSGLNKAMKDYKDVQTLGTKADPKVKSELKDKLKDEMEGAMKAAAEIAMLQKDTIGKLNIFDEKKLKDLPDEAKKVIKDIKSNLESNILSSTQLLTAQKSLNLQVKDETKKSLEDAIKASAQMTENFRNTEDIVGNIGKKLEGLSRGFFSILGVSGITGNPFKDLLNVYSGTTKEYRNFGKMNYDGSMAAIAQGGNIDPNVLANNRNIGMEFYAKTNGMVDVTEYANMYNSLLTNVQGKPGQDKTSGAADISDMTRTSFDIAKVFGISDGQMTDIVKTFYKDLNQTTKEVNDNLMSLTQTAQAANVPVGEYLKTMATMAKTFKGMGVDMSTAETAMRNFMLGYNMNSEDASKMATAGASAVQNMSNNPGKAAFYGIMSGDFSDPFSAQHAMRDLWNDNGSIKTGNMNKTFNALNTDFNMMKGLTGNSDANWNLLYDEMKKMTGADNQTTAKLTNFVARGDQKSFSDLYTKTMKEAENKEKTVKLEGQAGLESKLAAASSNIDELTKAEHALRLVQMANAEILKPLYDLIGKSLQSAIITLGQVILNASKVILTIGDALNSTFGKVAVIGAIMTSAMTKLTSFFGAFQTGLGDILEKLGFKGLGQTLKNGVLKTAGEKISSIAGSSTIGKIGKTAAAFGKKIPLIGSLLTGGIATVTDIMNDKSFGYSLVDGLLTGGGSLGGGIAGGAIGGATGAAVGGGVGALVGGVGAVPGAATGAAIGTFTGNITGQIAGAEAGHSLTKKLLGDGTRTPKTTDLLGHNTTGTVSNIALGTSNIPTGGNFVDMMKQNEANINLPGQENIKEADSLLSESKQTQSLKNNTSAVKTADANANMNAKTQQEFNQTSYNKLLEQHKDKMDASTDMLRVLTDISNKTDAGFEFLDKALHSITDLLSNLSISGSSGASSSGGYGTKDYSNVLAKEGSALLNKNLKEKTPMTAEEINAWIDKNAPKDSLMKGMGEAFIKAAQMSGLDPAYLVAHSAQETGWGAKHDAGSGVESILSKKNNWFGIGAYNSSPMGSAFSFGDREQGIIEGAKWIAEHYTNKGQDTLYKMLYAVPGHAYATYDDEKTPNKEWMTSIANIMAGAPVDASASTTSTSSNSTSTSNNGLVTAEQWKQHTGRDAAGEKVATSDVLTLYDMQTGQGAYASSESLGSSSSRSSSNEGYKNAGATVTNMTTGTSTSSDFGYNSPSGSNATINTTGNSSSTGSSNSTSDQLAAKGITNDMLKAFTTPLGNSAITNGAQNFDPSQLTADKVDPNYLGNYTDGQSLARSAMLKIYKDSKNSYTASYNPHLGTSASSSSTAPSFKIEINANSSEQQAKSWATDIQKMVHNYITSQMANTTKITSNIYNNNASQY